MGDKSRLYGEKIKDWIGKLEGDLTGRCAEITQEMVREFPKLKRVRGHYHCSVWGEREHWWCVDADDALIDPTAAQFPSKGLGEYAEWDESQQEPTGKCRECGSYCYNDSAFCSDDHAKVYMAYINGSL